MNGVFFPYKDSVYLFRCFSNIEINKQNPYMELK